MEPAEPVPKTGDECQLIETIRAHIRQGDKYAAKAELNAEKRDQHYIAAGQHLKTLKATHGGNWAEWENLLKTKIGIGKSRASELMLIADGTKTVEEVRAEGAERKAKERAQKSLRDTEKITENALEEDGPRYTLPCCGREVRVLPCGHAEGIRAYASFDQKGNPIWVASCCGKESPRFCEHYPGTALLEVSDGPVCEEELRERDRQEVIALYSKSIAPHREFGQSLVDCHPHYSDRKVAGWLNCSPTRIREYRQWAEGGFKGPPPDHR
jgi:hypothetical protein